MKFDYFTEDTIDFSTCSKITECDNEKYPISLNNANKKRMLAEIDLCWKN